MYLRQCAVFKQSELQNIINSYEEGQDILIYINGWRRIVFKDKNTGEEFRDYKRARDIVYAIISDYLRDYVGRSVKISDLSYPDSQTTYDEIEVTFE